jgi:hypothetical protein
MFASTTIGTRNPNSAMEALLEGFDLVDAIDPAADLDVAGEAEPAPAFENIPNSDPPRVRIVSDKAHYSPYERLVEETNIVGRIR